MLDQYLRSNICDQIYTNTKKELGIKEMDDWCAHNTYTFIIGLPIVFDGKHQHFLTTIMKSDDMMDGFVKIISWIEGSDGSTAFCDDNVIRTAVIVRDICEKYYRFCYKKTCTRCSSDLQYEMRHINMQVDKCEVCFLITKIPVDSSVDTCSICLQSNNLDSTRLECCSQRLHSTCIMRSVNPESVFNCDLYKCPLCRCTITMEFDKHEKIYKTRKMDK